MNDNTSDGIMSNLIPYIVHESAQARSERMTRRLILALVIAVVLIFASNAIWLYAWMQYDYTSDTTETVTVDGKDGVASYASKGGSIVNGIGTENDYSNADTYSEGWLKRYAPETVDQ